MPSSPESHTHTHMLVPAQTYTKPIGFSSAFFSFFFAWMLWGWRRKEAKPLKVQSKRGPRQDVHKGGWSLFLPIISECVSLWRRLKALPLVVHVMEARQEAGGGVLYRLSLRGAREFKKEVKEPFSLDAEGEESVHAFTVPGNSSTTCPSSSRMCIQACKRCIHWHTFVWYRHPLHNHKALYWAERERLLSPQGVWFHHSSNN